MGNAGGDLFVCVGACTRMARVASRIVCGWPKGMGTMYLAHMPYIQPLNNIAHACFSVPCLLAPCLRGRQASAPTAAEESTRLAREPSRTCGHRLTETCLPCCWLLCTRCAAACWPLGGTICVPPRCIGDAPDQQLFPATLSSHCEVYHKCAT